MFGSRRGVTLAVAAAGIALLAQCGGPSREAGRPTEAESPGNFVARVPLPTDYFVENAGQVKSPDLLFYHRAGGVDVAFAHGAVLLVVPESAEVAAQQPPETARNQLLKSLPLERSPTRRSVLLRITFEGANPVRPVPRDEMGFTSSYFLGADPGGWRTGVRAYREIVYTDLYDGIDLVFRPDLRGLKYEFHVAPGADPERIELVYEGLSAIELAPDGEIVLRTEVGDLRDSVPLAEDVTGGRIPCKFVKRGLFSYGFECDAGDARGPLVIDPLIYATFAVGRAFGPGFRSPSLAVDAGGAVHVAGLLTALAEFPATPGAFDTTFNGLADVFVLKLRPDGSGLEYATFLGGPDADWPLAIDLDDSGSVFIVGGAGPDFPTTPGVLRERTVYLTGFVTRLSPDGSDLIYSTYVPESSNARGLAVTPAGEATIAGSTGSTAFPTTPGAFQVTRAGAGGTDAYVARLNPDGTGFLLATYLGGRWDEVALALELDPTGDVYVAGRTASLDFPVTPGGFQSSRGGSPAAFIAKLSADLSSLLYGTFLGGSGSEAVLSLAVDSTGQAYATGVTSSPDFPVTAGAIQESPGTGQDYFLVKMRPDGGGLVFGTYLPADFTHIDRSGIEVPRVAVSPDGGAHLTGTTASSAFPVTPGAFDPTFNGTFDAFVARVNHEGSGFGYSTFLGGSELDSGQAIAIGFDGSVYVAGFTSSPDFPVTSGAFDTTLASAPPGGDLFVARLEIPPPPCPRGQGYWKNHSDAWPVLALDLGSEAYDQDDLLALLNTPPIGDASLILTKQLIAAKLNIANGSDSGPVLSAIADADTLLAAQGGRLPFGVHASTPTGQAMLALKDTLDEYNNNLLTPGCTP